VDKIGSVRVDGVGPLDADIWCIGEAPGKDEVLKGEPFIGSSGNLLTRFLERNGKARNEVRFDNLCKFRPVQNKFANLIGSQQLADGIEELTDYLDRFRPNVVVALGGWPLYHLTSKTSSRGKAGGGILQWRGSVLPCTMVEGLKVCASVHPSYILRTWKFHPVFNFDIQRAVRESTFAKIRYPVYESYIDPPKDLLYKLAEEMSEAEWLSCDIETFGTRLGCVGFADSAQRGLCLTYNNIVGWDVAQELLMARPKKIFQFGTFDVNWLHHHYGWEVRNIGWDTYVATANLMPEFKRGLDFLTSVYTDLPYYKDEGKMVHKTWREGRDFDDLNQLWEYNIKDVIATYIIAMDQIKEIEELYHD
jgi:DNA polymerase